MTKNKVFNVRLYKEGLRICFPFFIVLMLISLTSLVINYQSILYVLLPYIKDNGLIDYKNHNFATSLMAIPNNVHMLLSFILPIKVFDYLNSRSKCDFYYSLPYTRVSMFANFSLAAITYSVLHELIPAFITIALKNYLNTPIIVMDEKQFLLNTFVVILTGFTILGAGLMAQSFSGTSISAIISATLIVISPSLLTVFIIYIATESFSIFPLESIAPFASGQYSMITRFFSGMEIFDNTFNTILLTGLIAIVYYIIAFVIYVIRPSEAAEMPSVNQRAHTFVMASILTLILTFEISVLYESKDSCEPFDIIVYTALILFIGIGGIILYNKLATKSIGRIKDIFPAIGLSILLCIIIMFIANGVIGYQKSYSFEPADIDDFTIVAISKNDNTSKTYVDQDLYATKYNNMDANEIIHKIYSNTIKYYDKHGYSSDIPGYYTLHILINLDQLDSPHYIDLLMSKDDYKELTDLLTSKANTN